MPILLQKLDALRNYDTQIADLQQRLSTSQSEFNACSANLSIANFQLERLNTIVRATSNQLNRSTRKVIELRTTVLDLSSLQQHSFPVIAQLPFARGIQLLFCFFQLSVRTVQAHLPAVLGTGSSHCTAPGSAGAGMRRIRARRVRRTPTSSPQRLSFTRTRQQANDVRVLLWASPLQVADRRLQPASAEARGAGRRTASGRGWGPSCGRGGAFGLK